MAYAGHQFGHFNPQLGDGRAILLGQVTGSDGGLYDIHMKGTGQTAFSRNGAGRAALGPVLREYLVSVAMAKLGVPTTRALAAVTTGEEVAREQLIPGGVITRVAGSFVRVGTFQYFMARDNVESITQLADYVIEHNYPQVSGAQNSYVALFEAIINRQAALIAQWMHYGFIHGVMNTDNMSIAGETIDYGPCAFMDAYAHDQVYSSIDHRGRYAYGNQPSIGLWNLTRLAESLLPLLADNTEAAVELAQEKLEAYIALYEAYWLRGMRQKTGLSTELNDDKALIDELFDVMAANKADFTLTFHYLSQCCVESSECDKELRTLFDDPEQFDRWAQKWRARLRQEASDGCNPPRAYVPANIEITFHGAGFPPIRGGNDDMLHCFVSSFRQGSRNPETMDGKAGTFYGSRISISGRRVTPVPVKLCIMANIKFLLCIIFNFLFEREKTMKTTGVYHAGKF